MSKIPKLLRQLDRHLLILLGLGVVLIGCSLVGLRLMRSNLIGQIERADHQGTIVQPRKVSSQTPVVSTTNNTQTADRTMATSQSASRPASPKTSPPTSQPNAGSNASPADNQPPSQSSVTCLLGVCIPL